MTTLQEIKPTRKHLVFDLAEEAGFDISDWIASSNAAQGPKANPKYCYEWAFIEPGRLIILNLWHPAMTEENGQIVSCDNFRDDAEYHRKFTHKMEWAKRAQKLDDALQVALQDNLPVRVILIDGIRRSRNDPQLKPSRVTKRELDPEPWTITNYDWNTGEYKLTRGIVEQAYVDQFDLDQAYKAEPQRTEVTATPFIRDPAVRHRVKQRAKGKCELCGNPGFKMAGGAVYLETHHVVSLSAGGPDTVCNVVALCADDHRKAHYAIDRDAIATLLKRVANDAKTMPPNP